MLQNSLLYFAHVGLCQSSKLANHRGFHFTSYDTSKDENLDFKRTIFKFFILFLFFETMRRINCCNKIFIYSNIRELRVSRKFISQLGTFAP